MLSPKVSAIKEFVRDYDFSRVPPELKEAAQEARKWLPSPHRGIAFELHNANTAIANALRRAPMREVRTKALYYDALSIETNEEYIKPHELLDRIRLIPLSQDCPDDAVFSLDVANTTEAFTVDVLASDIKGGEKYFNPQFRIATLHQGKYLRIPRITVRPGFGSEHACWSLTEEVTYKPLDYEDVAILTPRGVIQHQMVSSEELRALLQKNKITIPAGKEPLFVMSPHQLHKVKIAERFVPVEKNIPAQLSTVARPRAFALSFMFYTVEPRRGMHMICDAILERLQRVAEELEKPESTQVRITRKDDLVHFYISGETFTLGNLIRLAVFDLDPEVSLVNMRLEHALNNAIIINIRHPDAVGLFKSALTRCAKDFEQIRAAFK